MTEYVPEPDADLRNARAIAAEREPFREAWLAGLDARYRAHRVATWVAFAVMLCVMAAALLVLR